MQFKGKLTQVLPLQTGEGRNGTWKKQEIIVETEGQYPKNVCVSIWGDKIPQQLNVGADLMIDFDIESREYNGRWYTDVKAWRVQPAETQSMPSAPPMDNVGFPEPPPAPLEPDFDDLPF